jgi:hypothetical protein
METNCEKNIKMNAKEICCDGVEFYTYDSGCGPMAEYCEHGSKHSGFIKGGEFLLRKDSISRSWSVTWGSADNFSFRKNSGKKKFQKHN